MAPATNPDNRTFRNLSHLLEAPEVMMGHIRIRQALPVSGLEQVSPFILLHHFNKVIEPGDDSFHVDPHPHRGFCPVTFLFSGEVEHQDSLGNRQTIRDHEVQWIHAGRGIIHSERAGKDFIQRGGRYQGVQLWINLPASQKMTPPEYHPITRELIPLTEGNGVVVRHVSGNFLGKTGPVKSDATTAMITMQPGGQLDFQSSGDRHLAIYILQGKVRINGADIARGNHLTVFEPATGTVLLEGVEEAELLLMEGTPIHEPLVTHGPFVMNTTTELLEAMRDYQQGKMGFLYAG